MTAYIDEHRGEFGVEPICARAADRPVDLLRGEGPAALGARPCATTSSSRRSAGLEGQPSAATAPRKVWRQLHSARASSVARCTVERLMRAEGLRGVVRGKRVFTTIPDETAPRPDDLVQRDFTAPRPEPPLGRRPDLRAHLGGLRLRRLRLRRLLSRFIVGWQAASHLRTDLALDALEHGALAAQGRRRAASSTTRDRGVQYLSIRYTERLAEAGIETSVGSRGDSLRQRPRRERDRPLQDRGDPPRGALEGPRGGRVRDARMGRLVQQRASAGADRLRPTGGVRGERTMLTLLPRKQRRDSNERASTEPGAVHLGVLGDLRVVVLEEPELREMLGLPAALSDRDRHNVEKTLNLFRERVISGPLSPGFGHRAANAHLRQ